MASCDSAPNIMVVTGPNGSGKSTLLDSLRHTGGGVGPILYVGPHRTSRRQQVRARNLFQNKIQMWQLLAQDSLPGYEGIDIPSASRTRTAWDFDESSSFLKHGLCQIELDRQTAVTQRLDADGEILKNTLPDIWLPLKEMTENLLPHLRFSKIDMDNRDQVRCLWHVHSKDIIIDIDDLSSGEKSIIQLFFPLVENRVQSLLDKTKGIQTEVAHEEVCILMDEPELHLHPVLQSKVLDYIRTVAIKEKVQFILATHSPTIVEQANSDELYLLRPAELVHGEDNQLVKIATDNEKLELMREIFGSTSNITAMRPLLIVEGRKEDKESKRTSDARIYCFLSEQFNQVTIVPGGGKAECIKLVSSLSDILKEFSPDLNAYALLDRDLECKEPDDYLLHYLPVSMIENLLVDPEIIWNAIVTVKHKTKFESLSQLESALTNILNQMQEEEISRRVKGTVGAFTFRVRDPISEIEDQIDIYINSLKKQTNESSLKAVIATAEKEVKKLNDDNKRREYYHGKNILNSFYREYLHETGMSKEIFIYECAKQASQRASVKKLVKELFEQIMQPSQVENNDND